MAPRALPPLADPQAQARLTDVENAMRDLEAASAEAERILLKTNWQELDNSIRDQRRLTHALQIAMDAAQDARTPEFDEAVRNRLRFIGLTRDRHIARVRKAQEEIALRINTLTRWKRAARKWLSGYTGQNKTTGIDLMR